MMICYHALGNDQINHFCFFPNSADRRLLVVSLEMLAVRAREM